jgi:hypothetical protein
MTRLIRRRPSPALIISVIALVAAVAGTAVAADPVANTSAITKKKVKKIAKKQANKAVDALLPVGALEFGTIQERSETFTINAMSAEVRTVDCNADEKLISGGWRWNDAPLNQNGLFVQADHRDGNGWRAGGRNGQAVGNNRQFTVYAYCLAP